MRRRGIGSVCAKLAGIAIVLAPLLASELDRARAAGVTAASSAPSSVQPGPSIEVAATASATSIAASLAAPTPSASTILDAPGARLKVYESSLAAAKLAGPAYATGGAPTPYAPDEVQAIVEAEQEAEVAGRLAEVISVITGVVESPRFELVAREPEGRAAWLLLGDALAQSGVHGLARVYLRKAASGPPAEGTSRAATRRLTELALEDEAYEQGIIDLTPVLELAPESSELRGERDYLVGRLAESEGDVDGADLTYSKIVPLSRFWSTATYRRGLLEVDRAKYGAAEKLFCEVADPKRQDSSAPVFADDRFFAVRDLARLALGRLAHEQLRHDAARYYYYLVPQDSQRLAEALYESATTRYEADDYDGARDLMGELMTLGEGHAYDDEAHVLDAYIDVAQCDFESAGKKLDAFLAIYGPLRTRVHALATGPDLDVRAFIDRGTELTANPDRALASKAAKESVANVDVDARVWRRVEADPALLFILRARRRLAVQLGGLSGASAQLDGLAETVGGGTVKPSIDLATFGPTPSERAAAVRDALSSVRAEIDALEKASAPAAQIAPLRLEIDALTAKAAALESSSAAAFAEAPSASGAPGLPALIAADASRARSLAARGAATLAELDATAIALARDALLRLDKRAGRLVARARLAKIDVVLGRKKGLEIEVDALRGGVLPKDAIDSINAERYLRDDEEYWPFEGDEWVDEVIGVEIGER